MSTFEAGYECGWLIADIARLVANSGYAITVDEETVLTGANDLEGRRLIQSAIDRNVQGFFAGG